MGHQRFSSSYSNSWEARAVLAFVPMLKRHSLLLPGVIPVSYYRIARTCTPSSMLASSASFARNDAANGSVEATPPSRMPPLSISPTFRLAVPTRHTPPFSVSPTYRLAVPTRRTPPFSEGPTGLSLVVALRLTRFVCGAARGAAERLTRLVDGFILGATFRLTRFVLAGVLSWSVTSVFLRP